MVSILVFKMDFKTREGRDGKREEGLVKECLNVLHIKPFTVIDQHLR